MSILDPRGFNGDFVAWADRMSPLIQNDVPQFAIMQPVMDADDPNAWREWALCVVGGQDRLGQDSPNPYEFDDWEDWAMRLFQTQDFAG